MHPKMGRFGSDFYAPTHTRPTVIPSALGFMPWFHNPARAASISSGRQVIHPCKLPTKG
jgi:hypothetical protein